MSTRKKPMRLGHRDAEFPRSDITDTRYTLRCFGCGLEYTSLHLLEDGELVACPACSGRHLLVVDVVLRPKGRG